MFLLGYFQHQRQCSAKQTERAQRIAALPPGFTGRPSRAEITDILTRPLDELANDVRQGRLRPVEVVRAFSKSAMLAHEKTNCATEILISSLVDEKGAATRLLDDYAVTSSRSSSEKPLAGIPVSLKDTVVVKGYDSTVGFSDRVGETATEDGPMVRLLRDAGAVPLVKTNIPTTLLSFESANDVWGRTSNPHKAGYGPGGSSGGEGAMLALNGTRVGIGSDVAGSVRLPAGWSGCAALRFSTGRWPRSGTVSSMPGQEGVPSVFSPMGRTAADLSFFIQGVMKMRPWRYDHSVHEIPWDSARVEKYRNPDYKLRVGVMYSDGVVDPTAPCARALNKVKDVLRANGAEVIQIMPPAEANTITGLALASALLNSDGCETFGKRLGRWQTNDPGAAQMLYWARMPRPIRWLYWAWVRYVRRDYIWAYLLSNFYGRSSEQLWQLVAQREAYRARWHDWWNRTKLPSGPMDVIISPVNATPALPHGTGGDSFAACGYTFLWNMLDYAAGVVPVTTVDARVDSKSTAGLGTHNAVAEGAYKHFDAGKMHGLPVGVQVIGRRLEEEKVMGVLRRIEDLVGYRGYAYAWDPPKPAPAEVGVVKERVRSIDGPRFQEAPAPAPAEEKPARAPASVSDRSDRAVVAPAPTTTREKGDALAAPADTRKGKENKEGKSKKKRRSGLF